MTLEVVAYTNDPEAVWASFKLSGYRERYRYSSCYLIIAGIITLFACETEG